MFACGDCGKYFPAGWRARENHCNATGHSRPAFECDTCDKVFKGSAAKDFHMDHWNHYAWVCNECGETWPSESKLKHHQAEEHHYCADCDRYFQSYNNIRMVSLLSPGLPSPSKCRADRRVQHLNSRTHRGQNIQCPFCRTAFTTATGVTHHLERGRCPEAPGLNRDQIYKIVRAKDPNGIITKNLIGWYPESDSYYEATARAWNGYGYECYFCHREFHMLNSLNQHLNSDARMCFSPASSRRL